MKKEISLSFILCISFFKIATSSQCGYGACNIGKPGMLNVHLVPHGHCDTGWDKTVDQYYYGSKNKIMNVGIQYNLDAIIQGLLFNKERRFTWIEVAYFWRWWGEQEDNIKAFVKQLVSEGRLMFGNNAWEMNDEASAYYQEIIDQHTLGERFLTETFGECGRPLTAWQIDTFGHSNEMASLLAQMGHDSLYFGRLDYQDKIERIKTKRMELLWHGNRNLGESSDLFTGVLYNSYLPPEHFCYSCGDDPIMDDSRLFDYNVDQMVDLFIKSVTDWASAFQTNHILIPMGNDFDYELANRWFKNEDKLIKYVNARQANGSKINVLYSTIPCYTYAVHSTNYTFPTKTDDFFPYASRDHTFWTGSFTSRPTMKGYVRDTNAFLQSVSQLTVLSGLHSNHEIEAQLFLLRRGLAINLNHGQLPGTQTQLVTYDNALRLSNGTIEAFKALVASYEKLTDNKLTNIHYCGLLNVSECSITENSNSFVVTVYNQLPWPLIHWMRVPINSQLMRVINNDEFLTVNDYEIVPISNRTQSIPERKGKAKFEAVFPVYLPPLGFNSYRVKKISERKNVNKKLNMDKFITPDIREDFTISSNILKLTFNGSSNLLNTITDVQSQTSFKVQIDIQYYTSFVGNNAQGKNQASGAYIFRPNEKAAWKFPKSNIKIFRGHLVQEVHQEFSEWATLVIRLYQDTPYVEVEWTVGPIPFSDKNVGKEVIVNYETDFQNNRTCYSDANGRQILKRMYNHRDTWDFNNTEPVAGNYNPINSAIYIRDERKQVQLTALIDRAQGGASLRNGQMEIMVHRRMGVDDGLGVNEALNELGSNGKGLIARGRHWLLVNTTKLSPQIMRKWMNVLQSRPVVAASNSTDVPIDKLHYSGLRRPLPINLKIVSLEGWKNGSVLLRLEHTFEKLEDPQLSNSVTVDIEDLFVAFTVISGEEVSLAGSIPKSQMSRLTWKYRNSSNSNRNDLGYNEFVLTPGNMKITLQPMEIKTYSLIIRYVK